MGQRVRSFDISPWFDRGAFTSAAGPPKTRKQADRVDGPGCSAFVYRVQPGDTPFRIAQRFGIPASALLGVNPQVRDPRNVQAGALICVPARPRCPEGTRGIIYTVLQGDTLESVADTFEVLVEQLLAVNPQIEDPGVIYPGEPICIPKIVGVAFPCCALLLPTSIAPREVEAAGSAVIRPVGIDEGFEALFSAVGLPEPGDVGPFDGFVGNLQVRETAYWAVLGRSQRDGESPTWSGATRMAAPPREETELLIVPADLESRKAGEPIMRGFVSTCGG